MAQAIEKFGETFGIGSLHPGRAEGSVPRFMSRPTPDGASVEAFLLSTMVVGLAEIGDKTQIATIGLAARFEQFYPVVLGTTLGMMLANIPAVLIGDKISDKLPVKAIRITAAVMFAVLGALTLAGIGR